MVALIQHRSLEYHYQNFYTFDLVNSMKADVLFVRTQLFRKKRQEHARFMDACALNSVDVSSLLNFLAMPPKYINCTWLLTKIYKFHVSSILPILQKGVLWLNEHDDVIETQTIKICLPKVF